MRGEYALNDVNALFFRCDVEDCFSRGVLCTANLDESLHAYYKAQALQIRLCSESSPSRSTIASRRSWLSEEASAHSANSAVCSNRLMMYRGNSSGCLVSTRASNSCRMMLPFAKDRSIISACQRSTFRSRLDNHLVSQTKAGEDSSLSGLSSP